MLCTIKTAKNKVGASLSLSLSLQCTQGNCHITGLENCGEQKRKRKRERKEKEKGEDVIRDKVRKQKPKVWILNIIMIYNNSNPRKKIDYNYYKLFYMWKNCDNVIKK